MTGSDRSAAEIVSRQPRSEGRNDPPGEVWPHGEPSGATIRATEPAAKGAAPGSVEGPSSAGLSLLPSLDVIGLAPPVDGAAQAAAVGPSASPPSSGVVSAIPQDGAAVSSSGGAGGGGEPPASYAPGATGPGVQDPVQAPVQAPHPVGPNAAAGLPVPTGATSTEPLSAEAPPVDPLSSPFGVSLANLAITDNDAIAVAQANTFIDSISNSVVYLGGNTATAIAYNLSPVDQANWAVGVPATMDGFGAGSDLSLNAAITDNDAIAFAEAGTYINEAVNSILIFEGNSALASATNLAPVTQMNSYLGGFSALENAGHSSLDDGAMPLPVMGEPTLDLLLSGLLSGGALTNDKLTDTSAPAAMAPSTIMEDMFPDTLPWNEVADV